MPKYSSPSGILARGSSIDWAQGFQRAFLTTPLLGWWSPAVLVIRLSLPHGDVTVPLDSFIEPQSLMAGMLWALPLSPDVVPPVPPPRKHKEKETSLPSLWTHST